MKSFAHFFQEAVETLASTEAKNRGLQGNGHGDWYDAKGNFVAKTVGGKLKYFGAGDTKSVDGKPGEEVKRQKPQQAKPAAQQPEQEPENGLVVVLGKFNPPSKNHEGLLRAGFSQANRLGYEFRIYPSRVTDPQSNPLNPTAKIDYMKQLFPKYADYVVDSEESRTIFDILQSTYNDGYTAITLVVGQERLGEFQSLVHKGEGQGYQFNNIEVISAGVKDPDSDVESPGSAALMRTAVAMDDFENFKTGVPMGISDAVKRKLFSAMKKSMEATEVTEAWKIAPELDRDGLRWNYKNNGLFEVGTIVENLNTGLRGIIKRRGANYLICVTEDGIMFKSWLRDVMEVHEVGTDEYRQYVQQLTPGQTPHSYTGVSVPNTYPKKKSINNKRKK